MRETNITRDTAETKIALSLRLDGAGKPNIDTGVGFFDHMLTLFAFHGSFDLTLRCDGDTRVDGHHTVEDCGITLGAAFKNALGDGAGIRRYGYFVLPMDEALAMAAVDASGRAVLVYDVALPAQKVGDFDTELAREFFAAFARASGMTVHVKLLYGENTHHILEAVFKAFARALGEAVSRDDSGRLPSTKGVLL